MKQLTKLLACLLALMLSASCAAAAVKPVDHKALERFPSYTADQETGKWSVQTYQADALIDRLFAYGSKYNYLTSAFHLCAEGDMRTGVWTPVLRVYVVDGDAISARAVSLMANGQRVDLAASSAQLRNGRQSAEVISAPLNQQALAFVSGLTDAQSVALRLIGDEVYTIEIDLEKANNERRLIEAESLRQLGYGVSLMNELGAESYALWDLSAAAWEREYGFRPAMTVSQGITADEADAQPDVMGMILPDDTGDAAEAAQETLAQYGFFSGEASRGLDEKAVAAVLRAQKYLGRVETGCFDAALAAALAWGPFTMVQTEAVLQNVSSAVQVCIDRSWFAKGVSASKNPDTLRSVVNQDNLFLVSDGRIASLSPEDMHLFVEMEASVVYNGQYAYQAELVLEGSDGMALDTLLLPLAQARLIAYAEVPAALASDGSAAWSLVLTHDGESLTIDLK